MVDRDQLREQLTEAIEVAIQYAWDRADERPLDAHDEALAAADALLASFEICPRGDVTPPSKTSDDGICDRCGRPNVVWFVASDLWNAVMPKPAFVCPVCFVQAYEATEPVPTGWELVPEKRDD